MCHGKEASNQLPGRRLDATGWSKHALAHRLQYSHFFFSALRAWTCCAASNARILRRWSSDWSYSMKPPAAPVRLAPTLAASLEPRHMLHS